MRGRSGNRPVWMHCETCWPEIVLTYIGGRKAKSAPQIAILNRRESKPIAIRSPFAFRHRHEPAASGPTAAFQLFRRVVATRHAHPLPFTIGWYSPRSGAWFAFLISKTVWMAGLTSSRPKPLFSSMAR